MSDTLPLIIKENFFTKDEADYLYEQILKEVEFKREKVFLYGEWHMPKRSIAFHSDKEISYTYSGVKKEGLFWTPILQDIKDRIECELNIKLNAVLVNYYDDGESSMGWHTDAEPDLDENSEIVSLSFGAGRDFQIRKIKKDEGREVHSFLLNHGSLVIMKKGMQKEWEHCIPKRTKIKTPRINLTFRKMKTKEKQKFFNLNYLKDKNV